MVRLGDSKRLGSGQCHFGEGKSRKWTVEFGGLGSKESKGKLLRLCWL